MARLRAQAGRNMCGAGLLWHVVRHAMDSARLVKDRRGGDGSGRGRGCRKWLWSQVNGRRDLESWKEHDGDDESKQSTGLAEHVVWSAAITAECHAVMDGECNDVDRPCNMINERTLKHDHEMQN